MKGPGISTLLKLRDHSIHVHDSECEMIIDANLVMARVRWNTQHVLDPVSPIRHLDREEVGDAILHVAVPAELEAQDVSAEAILRSRRVHKKAGMDNAP